MLSGSPITLLLTDESAASGYDASKLNPADRARIERTPKLAERADWQVSRYLKQQARQTVLSLSHSRGWALLAEGDPAASKTGVDLEYRRPRDVQALLAWVADENEQQWVLAQPDPLAAFYTLWTVKESLIKAENLSFPTDLQSVGLRFDNGIPQLRTRQSGAWHGISGTIGQQFAFSAVWQHSGSADWRFFGATHPHMVNIGINW